MKTKAQIRKDCDKQKAPSVRRNIKNLTGLTFPFPIFTFAVLFIILLTAAAGAITDAEMNAARDEILAGVSTIHSGVQPGRMIAFGSEAFNITMHPGEVTEGPMMTAAIWGSGRVIAVPDHQMLNMDSYGDQGDSGRFYKNGLAWLTQSTALTIGIVTYQSGTADWLTAQGYTSVVVATESSLAASLSSADVFVGWMGSSESQANLTALANFAKNGGGIFLAEYGVGYRFWWGKPYPEAPGNILLREPGIGFPDGHRWDTDLIDASNRASGQFTADDLLAMLQDSSGASQEEKDYAGYMLDALYDILPDGDPLLEQLDTYFWARIYSITPTPATPVSDSFDQAMLNREMNILDATPLNQLTAHRSAEGCFGAIPVDAPRVTKTVTIDTAKSRWHSTGLYAAPGELTTLTLPASITGKGFKVRISGHRDNISAKSSWKRMPKGISKSFKLDSTTIPIASPYGGAIYIDVGSSAPSTLPDFDISFEGPLEAPYFVLGQTTDAEWIATIRDNPAPYAELVSEHVAISLPSFEIRDMDDPTDLMTFWNQVVAGYDDLSGNGYRRTNEERMNLDVQISAGAAHSGYPTQAPVGSWSRAASNYAKLVEGGSWGWFHELGHEAQRRPDKTWGSNNPYTFNDSVEVTVNIFSSYAMDHYVETPASWTWIHTRSEVMNRAIATLAGGKTYDDGGAGDKLSFLMILRDGFGWDALRNVIRSYDSMTSADTPANDGEERDQWLMRFSNETGFNLIRYMRDNWGLIFSQSAIDSVSHLPDWMPAYGDIVAARTQINTPLTLDLKDNLVSLDGVANLTGATQPTVGSLTDHGDGTYTYTPPADYTGADAFSYTVVSSAGNSYITTVDVTVTNEGALLETWLGISGNEVSKLTGDPRYPAAPDESEFINKLETNSNRADAYGSRIRAFIVPPADGDYTFWIASDDNGELLLSTDNDPVNATLIASVPDWTNSRQWTKFPEQQSVAITLKANTVYYIEALMKEGGGGDNFAVAWQGPGITQQVIASEYLRVTETTVTPSPKTAARSWILY